MKSVSLKSFSVVMLAALFSACGSPAPSPVKAPEKKDPRPEYVGSWVSKGAGAQVAIQVVREGEMFVVYQALSPESYDTFTAEFALELNQTKEDLQKALNNSRQTNRDDLTLRVNELTWSGDTVAVSLDSVGIAGSLSLSAIVDNCTEVTGDGAMQAARSYTGRYCRVETREVYDELVKKPVIANIKLFQGAKEVAAKGQEIINDLGGALKNLFAPKAKPAPAPAPAGGEQPAPAPAAPAGGEQPAPAPVAPAGGEQPAPAPAAPAGGDQEAAAPVAPAGAGQKQPPVDPAVIKQKIAEMLRWYQSL